MTNPPAQNGLSAEDHVEPKKHGFLRTNIEAFTVAIVLALTIKQFAFEAFRVPTPSMEPTIIGRADGGDQLIVNKFTYMLRDPKRWEVVVFRYPLARMVNYVKRLIGMPGEVVYLLDGDIFVGPSLDGPFKIARKPEKIQNDLFDGNPALPLDVQDSMSGVSWRAFWDVPNDAAFDKSSGKLTVSAKSGDTWVRTRHRVSQTQALVLTNDRFDKTRDPAAVLSDKQRFPVSDLRIRVEVTPNSGCNGVLLSIEDWTQKDRPIQLVLGVEGGAAASSLHHGDEDLSAELKGIKVPSGSATTITLDNVDDTLFVWVDGDLVVRHPYDQNPETLEAIALLATEGSRVGFGARGGSAEFTRVHVFRDVYHTRDDETGPKYEVPKGHYLFMGDNSPFSLDGRAFRVVGIRLRDDGTILLGDRDAVSDDIWMNRRPSNPYMLDNDDDNHYFVDIMGNRRKLDPGSYDLLNMNEFEGTGDEILALHGKKIDDPGDRKVAYRAMRSRDLRRGPEAIAPFQTYARPMNYVARKEVIGRANLVFLSFRNNWGIIR